MKLVAVFVLFILPMLTFGQVVVIDMKVVREADSEVAALKDKFYASEEKLRKAVKKYNEEAVERIHAKAALRESLEKKLKQKDLTEKERHELSRQLYLLANKDSHIQRSLDRDLQQFIAKTGLRGNREQWYSAFKARCLEIEKETLQYVEKRGFGMVFDRSLRSDSRSRVLVYSADRLVVTADYQKWVKDSETKFHKKTYALNELKLATVDMGQLYLKRHGDEEMSHEAKATAMDEIAQEVEKMGKAKGLDLVFDTSAEGSYIKMIHRSPKSIDLTEEMLLVLSASGLEHEADVMTFNIRYDASGDWWRRSWKHRLSLVAPVLEKASIIGVQEAKHHQAEQLIEKLPHYAYVGVGRKDGKLDGEFCAIFYDTRHWKVLDFGTFWLSDTPQKIASKSWGNSVERICTWARMENKAGAKLYVFNTHFDHISQSSREKSAELILEKIKQRLHPKEPVILLGDFNATLSNNAIKILANAMDSEKKPLLVDSYLSTKPEHKDPATFNHWKADFQGKGKIDFIFHSPEIKTVKSEILNPVTNGAVASDHLPQISTIQW